MSDAEHRPPIEPTKGDAVHGIVKAGLSSIPLVGGAASKLFAMLVAPPLDRRRTEWMEEIGAALAKLEETGMANLSDLQENEEFLDTVLQATRVAMSCHQEEKRGALRGAILSTAIGESPGEALRHMFLGFVDYFSTWHLRLLFLFDDITGYFEGRSRLGDSGVPYMKQLWEVAELAFPELRNQSHMYEQVWSDLYQRGLVKDERMRSSSTSGRVRPRTTDLGRQFISFIQEPENEVPHDE